MEYAQEFIESQTNRLLKKYGFDSLSEVQEYLKKQLISAKKESPKGH
jgi:hypothetical protein